jgi:para-nitrobenzyl esterase
LTALLLGGLTGEIAGLPAPVVETRYGKVQGAVVDGVSVFKGIPYGASTEGAGRFMPPAKPQPWASIRDATAAGPRCVQGPGAMYNSGELGDWMTGGRAGILRAAPEKDSEDCLVLNVLTPGLKGKKRPVMVYIHGGGFGSLSGIVPTLATGLPREQDIVLVSVNHRLNVLGYLYLGEISSKYADSGNAGMLDLILVLEWVRDNIAGFGGDPRNVTIFGESGGGGKVSALMGMPAAQGLFHKAIVQSGSLLDVATREEATKTARELLAHLGLAQQQVDELQNAPAAKLWEAAHKSGGAPAAAMRFRPAADGRALPHQPWEPGAPEISARVPMIVGSCKDETTLFMGRDPALSKLDEPGLRERLVKMTRRPEAEIDALIATYRKAQPGSTPRDLLLAITSDGMFRMGAIAQAERKVKQGKAPVWMYLFTYDTPIMGGVLKAFHTADLPLVMRLVQFPEMEPLSKQLSAAWASFARRGDPNHDGMPAWPAYNLEERPTMVFNVESKVVNDPGREARLAWKDAPRMRLR